MVVSTKYGDIACSLRMGDIGFIKVGIQYHAGVLGGVSNLAPLDGFFTGALCSSKLW